MHHFDSLHLHFELTDKNPTRNNFIIGLITPPLVENTNWGAYLFFAVFCLLSGIWTFFFVRETNGRTLEEMDKVFGDTAGSADLDRQRRILADMTEASEARDAATAKA